MQQVSVPQKLSASPARMFPLHFFSLLFIAVHAEFDGKKKKKQIQYDLSKYKRGDLLEVPRTLFTHFGIYLGNNRVAHLIPDILPVLTTDQKAIQKMVTNNRLILGAIAKKASVRVDSVEDFAYGAEILINPMDKVCSRSPFPSEEVAERAEKLMGSVTYSLLWYNCEHYVMYCRYGTSMSFQTFQDPDIILQNRTEDCAEQDKLFLNFPAFIIHHGLSGGCDHPWSITNSYDSLLDLDGILNSWRIAKRTMDEFNSQLCENSKVDNSKEAALLALMDRTGYSMVQENGQRKFGGPPPDWEGPPPPRGCEVFVGKIPRDMYEDELVPVFEKAGRIYEFRLMMEFSGENRGYAFVMFTNREGAQQAIQLLDNFEIRPGKFIGVCVSLDNCRLFIGSIPKDKKKEEIQEEMMKVTEGVVDVIVYPSAVDRMKNRGFAFVEYESHKAAAMARRKLIPGTFQLWGQTIQVDWAEPEKELDEETMQRVRVLYVRNLMLSTTEDTLRSEFSLSKPGSVERVKKLTDYAFIHFYSREDALSSLESMNGKVIDGSPIEVSLAKPASKDGNKRSALRNSHNGVSAAGNYGDSNFLFQGRDDCSFSLGTGAMSEGLTSHPLSLPPHLGNPYAMDLDRCVYPFLPGSTLIPATLSTLKPSQLSSAVSLLDYYCHKNEWSLPEYHLYSLAGQEGKVLLIYKVVISSTMRSFMPDKVCTILEDAKELAAQNALWNLDCGISSSGSPSPHVSPPPPQPGSSFLSFGCRSLSYPAYPMASITPPLPISCSSAQRLFIPNQSSFL
ncbi:hypothetical protein DNTS_002024 [Danionella cerebrum]|uniref:Probable RNA-binding protein 46 n=1 Tax=Danionella cerebrum TaxID=2873325 RepID=A0A553Q4P6_9TELE|nr:hypothetical protein DNTS_002024 [Danionella translucida]